MSQSRPPRNSLSEILQIEERGGGQYGARLESFWGATIRGDALARAALVATRGESRAVASVHATFLTRLPPDSDLLLERSDVGGDLCRVRVSDAGSLSFEATFRFATASEGLTYQCAAPPPGLPEAESLPSEAELAAAEGWSQYAVGPIETRRIGDVRPVKDHEPAEWLGWLRPREPITDDAQQCAALVFLGEYRSHWGIELRLGPEFPQHALALLDFALWIHRPQAWTDWWLVKTSSEVGSQGRCFSRREIYTASGELVASAAWETTVRRNSP